MTNWKYADDTKRVAFRSTTGGGVESRVVLAIPAGDSIDNPDIPDPRIAILADIDQRERATMLPRAVREFMLVAIEDKATIAGAAQGLTKDQSLAVLTANNPGYRNIKALDDRIAVLRQATK